MTSEAITANWNGRIMPLSEVRVPATDRGYLFGDAVYETMRLQGGRVWFLGEHLARLAASLEKTGMGPAPADLSKRLRHTIEAAACDEATIYLQISRGAAPRRHVPQAGLTPNVLLWVESMTRQDDEAWQVARNEGIRCALHRDIRWGRCDIKTTNLLGNCLAAMAGARHGFDETVLFDREERITEGTHTSFFGVQRGSLVTAPLSTGILPGITRSALLSLAGELALPVQESALSCTEIKDLDEAFLVGTVSELVPVVQLGFEQVGDGIVGPMTRRLQRVYRERADECATRP